MVTLEDIDKTLSYQMFGKRLRDLTPEEKREYNRLRKSASRNAHPEKWQQELDYGKQYREENREKFLECIKNSRAKNSQKYYAYQKIYRDNKRGCEPYHNKLTFQIIGKKIKDMTPEELKAYNHQRYLLKKQKKENENEKIRNS